jgi:hypothetical protein
MTWFISKPTSAVNSDTPQHGTDQRLLLSTRQSEGPLYRHTYPPGIDNLETNRGHKVPGGAGRSRCSVSPGPNGHAVRDAPATNAATM